MPQKALCKHQAKGRGINQGNLTISVNPWQMKLIIPRKKGGHLPKKKFRKVLHRLLSDILKREDDYIETPLIVEKVRLIV